MKPLTREYIDEIAPEHSRTSCSDKNLNNGQFTIEETEIRGVVVKREFGQHPRCTRCCLLDLLHEKEIGMQFDPRLEITLEVRIAPKQPQFEIVQK